MPAAHRVARLPEAREIPFAASVQRLAVSSSTGEDETARSASRIGRSRTGGHSGPGRLASCSEQNPRRKLRGRHNPRKRANAPSSRRLFGSVWVCSSVDHLQPVLDRRAGKDRRVRGRRGRRRRSSRPRPAHSSVFERRGSRNCGLRPPAISCWVCAKNSISRMPPRPSLMLWPATAISPWPR